MSNVSIFLATELLFFASSLISSLMFYLWSRPHRVEVLGTFVGGVLIAWRFGLFGTTYAKVMIFLVYWSVCAIVVSFLIPFFSSRQLKQRVPVLERMLATPLLGLLAAVVEGQLNRLVPHTLDYYLYAFDSSLGYPPTFMGAQLLTQVSWLRMVTECAYLNLPLVMSFLYLIHLKRCEDDGRKFLRLLVLLGSLGIMCYVLFPGAGIDVLFKYKAHPPDISTVSVNQSPNLGEPRNCMPSLHTTMGLALWWTCPRKRWLRASLAFYLFFMLLYTFSGAGHYFVDMVAAVPFTLAVYAFTRTPNLFCRRSAAISMAIFLLWLLLLRYATGMFQLSPVVPWVSTVATLTFCHFLRRRVDASVTDMSGFGTECIQSEDVLAS